MSDNNKQYLLNRKNIASACGITGSGFDKWGVEPHSRQGRELMFSVEDVIANRVEYELNKKSNQNHFTDENGEHIDIEQERARLVQQQRITQELKNEILEGRVIPIEASSQILTKILARIAATLESIAPNIKRRNPEIPQRVIDFIKNEIIKHQNEAANIESYIDDIMDEFEQEVEAKV